MDNTKTYKLELRCATCGSDRDFEYNEDQSYMKCTCCNREYFGGIEELKELNEEALSQVKELIADDAKAEILKKMKDAFRGNKYIHIK